MAQFTDNGLVRETLTDLVTQERERIRQVFGNEALVTDDSVFGRLAAMVAERRDINNQYLELALSTFNIGAEGSYLDNVLGAYTTRVGRSAGTGVAFVEVDATNPNNSILPATTVFNAQNTITYSPTQDLLLTDNVSAYRLEASTLSNGTEYTFTIVSTEDDNEYSVSYTYSNVDSVTINNFLEQIRQFFLLHTSQNENTSYVDTTNNILYLGFDSNDNSLVGFFEITTWRSVPQAGNRYSGIPVTANTTGFFPAPSNTVNSMSPTPTGFVSVTNPEPFSAGSNVESDAEYRARHYATVNAIQTGTRAAVLDAVGGEDGVSGVTAVRIYNNVGQNPIPGIADPYSFNTVVIGGDSQEIAQAIYNTKGVTAQTSGQIVRTVNTNDGTTEDIRFTVGSERLMSLRVNYLTQTNTPLNTGEQQEIINNLVVLFNNYIIGSTIYNKQLDNAVFSALPFNRLLDLNVDIKTTDSPDSAFNTNNFVSDPFQRPILQAANVSFEIIV